MKKAILAIMVLGLCFGLTAAAIAQDNHTTEVTVTVESIEELTVPTSVVITLDKVDTEAATKYAQGTAEDGGQLTYTHNSADPKKITASATGDTGTDITLKVKVDDTIGPVEVVLDGDPVTEAKDVWTDIANGTYTKDLTWTADASLAETPADTYTFTVTITATDVTTP